VKVGDIVTSPLWGIPDNRGLVLDKQETIFHEDFGSHKYLILWMNGNQEWGFDTDLEVLSEAR